MWIKSHQELPQHPKTKRFARLLGISTPTAIGHLHMLWYFCMSYAPDGDLSVSDPSKLEDRISDIADAVEWDGEPQELMDALLNSGFVDGNWGNEMKVHDWAEYGGKLLEERKATAERIRKMRSKDGKAMEKKPFLRKA